MSDVRTSKERSVSSKLREIAGDLADIAANPPHEMDSRELAKMASQLLAVAGQVYLGESQRPTAPETCAQPPPNRNHDKDCPCYECANQQMCRICGRTGGLHREGCTLKAVETCEVRELRAALGHAFQWLCPPRGVESAGDALRDYLRSIQPLLGLDDWQTALREFEDGTGPIVHTPKASSETSEQRLIKCLQDVMERLADMLDSDHFNNIEAIVLAADVPYPHELKASEPRTLGEQLEDFFEDTK